MTACHNSVRLVAIKTLRAALYRVGRPIGTCSMSSECGDREQMWIHFFQRQLFHVAQRISDGQST